MNSTLGSVVPLAMFNLLEGPAKIMSYVIQVSLAFHKVFISAPTIVEMTRHQLSYYNHLKLQVMLTARARKAGNKEDKWRG